MMAAIESGAEDVLPEGDVYEIRSDVADFMAVRQGLEKAGIKYGSAELTMIPKSTVALDESDARKTFRLLEALEDNDDVQEVFANFDIPDEVMEALAQ
jgi:transcriptional/translational regulatory protein YebC/TACO1